MIDAATTDPIAARAPTSHTKVHIADDRAADPIAVVIAYSFNAAKRGGPWAGFTTEWYGRLLDSPDMRATAHRLSPHLLHFLGEPVTFGIHPDDVPGFLGRNGLELLSLATAGELESRYIKDGRHVYPANYVVHAAIGARS